MAQQLFARIKPESEYAYQSKYIRGGKAPMFPVEVRAPQGQEIGCAEHYSVKGGPGGQYRLIDVDLFIIDGEVEVQIA